MKSLYESKLEKDFAKVQEQLYEVLCDLRDGNGKVKQYKDGEIWVHGIKHWIRLHPDGELEMGE